MKGATKNICNGGYNAGNFNPRSREGSDTVARKRCGLVYHFNPRSREGSDRLRCPYHPEWRNFNPRSCEGSDRYQYLYLEIAKFQSTLP